MLQNEKGETAAMAAGDNADCVKALITGNADVNARHSTHGSTVINIATYHNKVPLLEELIALRGDPTNLQNQGVSPVHCAARRGYPEALEVLIHAMQGGNQWRRGWGELKDPLKEFLDLPNDNGKTALALAQEREAREVQEGDARLGEDKCKRILLEAGATSAEELNGECPSVPVRSVHECCRYHHGHP